jgi:glycosyltransferase involved in cell wall biosynthesis
MRKRIAFLSHASDLTGAPLSLWRTVKQLDRALFEPFVVFPQSGVLVDWFQQAGFQVKIIQRNFGYKLPRSFGELGAVVNGTLSAIRYIWNTSRYLSSCEVQIVHVNTLVEIPGSIAALISGKPIVWQVHEIPPAKIKQYLASRWARLVSRKILATSHAVGRSLGTSRKIQVLHNGFDLADFDEQASQPSPEVIPNWQTFINKWAQVVVFVGSVIPTKGVDYFLQMAVQVCSEHLHTGFMIVGGTPDEKYRACLDEYCMAQGLTDRVVFTGSRTDVPRILRHCQLLVLPSLVQEALPWVILESMAASLPVVASNIGGIPEMVQDNKTGILVPIADSKSLVVAVNFLLDDPESARRMGQEGRKRLLEEFTIDRYIQDIQNVYLSVCK